VQARRSRTDLPAYGIFYRRSTHLSLSGRRQVCEEVSWERS
jgi:hypothetical protein